MALPAFSEIRSRYIERILSKDIGQTLLIDGDVSVVLGPISRVRASGVQIPSENIEDVKLAELAQLEFDLDIWAVINGEVGIDNLRMDGLRIELLTLEDGTHSWSDADDRQLRSKPDDEMLLDDTEDDVGLLAFLHKKTASFTDIRLLRQNDASGLEFDFELTELLLTQLADGNTLGVTSKGQVNGQAFSMEGNYPAGAPFTTSAEFSTIDLSFDGAPLPQSEGGGFSGELIVNVEGVGDLLDVLKINRTLEGAGRIQSTITRSAGLTSITDFATAFEFDEGQLITAEGLLEDVANFSGLDVQVDARLYPEDNPPDRAGDLKDLKLTGVSARLINEGEGTEFEELLLSTNAFQRGLDEVGPVSIKRIRRTEDGQLAFEDIYIQSGPRDAPILVATGNIRNVLELQDLDFEGSINAPASLVLGELGDEVADAFGAVDATFAVDDSQGFLSLSRLTLEAVDTDIWAIDLSASIGEVTTLDGFELDLELDVADGADFLSALKLTPVDSGPLSVSSSVRGADGFWSGQLGLGAGQSKVLADVKTGQANGRTTINAQITSDSIVLSDLSNAIDGAIELGKIGEEPQEAEESSGVPVQPLVLPKDEEPETKPEARDDEIEVQPLVLPKSEKDEILDPDEFLRETDIYATIEFRKISGIQGVSRISSEFVSEGGKAKLGPLQFNYGGGYFNLQAAMDVVEAPDRLSVSGATEGWSLGEILEEFNVDFDATGDLSGRFALSGNISTVEQFLNSLTGSATVNMVNGRIATSLLELAGLGVFPWLFSQELRKGYSDVTCVSLPVRLTAGVVSFDPAVAETNSVQIVARGRVDLKNETIAVRAEPRPLGRPLARSAWPVNISGKLNNPNFDLQVGGSLSRRADGADQMPANRKPCQPDIFQLEQRSN